MMVWMVSDKRRRGGNALLQRELDTEKIQVDDDYGENEGVFACSCVSSGWFTIQLIKWGELLRHG